MKVSPDQIERLKKDLGIIAADWGQCSFEISHEIEERVNAVQSVAQSWSNSAFTNHTDYYFGEFDKPGERQKFNIEWGLTRVYPQPDGWRERSESEVIKEIEKRSPKKSLMETEAAVASLGGKAELFREKLLTELSVLEDQEQFKAEWNIASEIEKLDFSPKPEKYVVKALRVPGSTRDAEAVASGVRAPYHMRYRGRLESMLEGMAAIEELIRRSRRLLAQLEVKQVVSGGEGSLNALALIKKVTTRFHKVARQLKNRHSSRPTLEIGDEYDVQDLLYALLRIDFDDIRPEEWTGSYAGGTSRMDFLLKKERIVIEVKKTRKDLGDREIGEELIVDIARYKASPDCSTLICFVYDPEGLIRNPEGLSRDLEGMTTDEMAVFVLIEPAL